MGARRPKSGDTPKPETAAVEETGATSQPVETTGAKPPVSAEARSLELVLDVPVRVTVEVGTARLLVREVLQFEKGSVVELDRQSGEPADILVNGRVLARGEVTVVDDRLAVRVVEVVASAATERV